MPRNNQSAEDLPLPPGWKPPGTPHGYYGSASHNLKAIYQRYMGRLDGYPASLWQYPPQAAATGYVEVIGGQQAVLDKSRPTPTPVTCGSPPNCSTTPCSPTPATPPPGARR